MNNSETLAALGIFGRIPSKQERENAKQKTNKISNRYPMINQG